MIRKLDSRNSEKYKILKKLFLNMDSVTCIDGCRGVDTYQTARGGGLIPVS